MSESVDQGGGGGIEVKRNKTFNVDDDVVAVYFKPKS